MLINTGFVGGKKRLFSTKHAKAAQPLHEMDLKMQNRRGVIL